MLTETVSVPPYDSVCGADCDRERGFENVNGGVRVIESARDVVAGSVAVFVASSVAVCTRVIVVDLGGVGVSAFRENVSVIWLVVAVRGADWDRECEGETR
jgi:hypothetical protein